MRLGGLVAALAAGVLAGCGGNATPSNSSTEEATAAGEPWVVVEPGNPTPSPARKKGSPRPPLPPVSFLPTSSACAIGWPQDDLVLIPMMVTPVAAGFKVEWPASYGPTYRLAAIHQGLVAGAQPEPTWQTVPAGTNCTVTATITGLISGDPYVVWLDAPETPRQADGARSLYSGKSGVVRPL